MGLSGLFTPFSVCPRTLGLTECSTLFWTQGFFKTRSNIGYTRQRDFPLVLGRVLSSTVGRAPYGGIVGLANAADRMIRLCRPPWTCRRRENPTAARFI